MKLYFVLVVRLRVHYSISGSIVLTSTIGLASRSLSNLRGFDTVIGNTILNGWEIDGVHDKAHFVSLKDAYTYSASSSHF